MDDDYLPPGVWGWVLVILIAVGCVLLAPLAVAMLVTR